MNKIYIIIGILMLFALTSCNTVRVSTDYDRNANFEQYQTFAFHEKGLNDLNMNDLDKRRVVDAISQNLTSKGMIQTHSENPDLVINISASNKTRVNVD